MSNGYYNCEIEVSDPNSDNSPQTISVTVIYGPEIELSSDKFQFFSNVETGLDDQILNIRNSGGGTLNWEIIYDCNWLIVHPITGSSSGEPNEVILSMDISGLPDGEYDCELLIFDPFAVNSPQIVDVNLVVECFPRDHLEYSEWVKLGKPKCWCYPRQCLGDADGLPYGKFNYYVSIPDLFILKKAWNKYAQDLVGNEICADFDHLPYGKSGYRVSLPDLDILKANWCITAGPPPTCLPGNRNP